MVAALPARIMNYRVSADSPTDELLTLGQIFSEIGSYAATILDREHLSFARRCASRLTKVVGELIARRCIQSQDDLYEMPACAVANPDLGKMSVSELYSLYRRWPIRRRGRMEKGREPLTFYYEGRIVRELLHRKASDKSEQLKIDYCVAAYRNELENMSILLSLPVHADTPTDNGKRTTHNQQPTTNNPNPTTDPSRHYTQAELQALIKKYSNPRSVIDRELLIEYTDLLADL